MLDTKYYCTFQTGFLLVAWRDHTTERNLSVCINVNERIAPLYAC